MTSISRREGRFGNEDFHYVTDEGPRSNSSPLSGEWNRPRLSIANSE
jgi:hypothetical protein